MSNKDSLSDNYVAQLLREDAKTASQNALSQGLGAYLPKRATNNAPKPNTRFLRNILRETDSHNQALLAKEAEEARQRLRALRQGEREKGSRDEHRGGRGHEREQERSSKRRRLSEDDEHSRRREERTSREKRSRREGSKDRAHADSRKRERRHGARYEDQEDERYESRHADSRRRRRSRDRSKSSEPSDARNSRHGDRSRKHHRRDDEEGRGHRRRRRHDNGSRSRSRSPRRSKHKSSRRRDRTRSPVPSRRRSRSREWKHEKRRSKHRSLTPLSMDDRESELKDSKRRISPPDDHTGSNSDPLEDLVGPLPPPPPPKVKVRGRGAISSSAMDSRFSSNYDPSTDVTLDPDLEDDWGQALEALRDRTKYLKTQGDRLRAAGFTDEEIRSWENGGNKNEEDVRWSKKGEGREWDRGKVVGDDAVEVEAEWGRLKGT